MVIDESLVGVMRKVRKMLCRDCRESQTSMSRRADPQRRMHRHDAAMHSRRAVLPRVFPAVWHERAEWLAAKQRNCSCAA
ncbi:hypothetical protein UB46_04910 [Burkholderiaceae bacterium 16]|nr:hypothetical protein UB46_04910 [Burkholderiaceae bacterium 16]